MTATLGKLPLHRRAVPGRAARASACFTAGIVLAIMVIPFISSVMRDVFEIVPTRLKESAYALGSTTWEVVWDIVLPYTRVGVIGGIFLGLGRALGETMAVTFVIGNAYRITAALLQSRQLDRVGARQRIQRSSDPVHRCVADRARLRAVRADVHRARRIALSDRAPRAGRGGAHMSATFATSAATGNGQATSGVYRRRRWVNRFNLAMSLTTMAFGLLPGLDPLGAGREGHRRAVAVAVHRDDAAARIRRRPANAILGSLMIVGFATLIGTPIGILAGTYLAEYGKQGRSPHDTLHQRHPAVGAVDRARPVRLHDRRRARATLLGMGRRAGIVADRRAGRRAHHREDAAARAVAACARPRSRSVRRSGR